MVMHKISPIPNVVFDSIIRHLSGAELKVLLVIMRKTLGWHDPKTGNRKERDWIALSQFQEYTGLSNVSIWKAVDSLSYRQYILVTGSFGNVLLDADSRKGKRKLFYQLEPTLLKIF